MRFLGLLRSPECVQSSVLRDDTVPLGVLVDDAKDAGLPGEWIPPEKQMMRKHIMMKKQTRMSQRMEEIEDDEMGDAASSLGPI